MVAAGFLSHYLSSSLPYVRRHITINKILSASLNKILPSFLSLLTMLHFVNCNFGIIFIFIIILLLLFFFLNHILFIIIIIIIINVFIY